MILTDTVLMADGAAVVHDQFGGAGFERLPARECFLVAVAHPEHVGGVNAAALAVEVGEVGEHMGVLVLVFQPVTQAGLDQTQQIVDVVPVSGRFQSVDSIAHLPEGLSQIGHGKTLGRPFVAEPRAGIDAILGLADASGLFQGVSGLQSGAGDPEGHHAFALTSAPQRKETLEHADKPGVAGQRELGLGLYGIAEPEHG